MTYFLKIVYNLLDYWILILTMQYVCAGRMKLGRKNVWIGSCLSVMGTVAAFFLPLHFEFIVSMAVVIALSVCLFSQKSFRICCVFFRLFSSIIS